MHPSSHTYKYLFNCDHPSSTCVTMNLSVNLHLHESSVLERRIMIYTFPEGSNLLPRKWLNTILAATSFARNSIDGFLSQKILCLHRSLTWWIPDCISIETCGTRRRRVQQSRLDAIKIISSFMVLQARPTTMHILDGPTYQRVHPLLREVFLQIRLCNEHCYMAITKRTCSTKY